MVCSRRPFVGLRQLVPLHKKRWVVYSKPPFSGPEAVLAYLSRYTRRVAISNRRLTAFDKTGVTFRDKDYRRDDDDRQRIMTLTLGEFIYRFLLHVLPKNFHRIRHYGLLAGAGQYATGAQDRRPSRSLSGEGFARITRSSPSLTGPFVPMSALAADARTSR
jgi:putative transposase